MNFLATMTPMANYTPSPLGRVVRHYRRRYGLTQARVAALAGISRETLNGLETGRIHDIGFQTGCRLLMTLAIPLSALYR